MKLDKELLKQKQDQLNDVMKQRVDLSAMKQATKYRWCCWFITMLYVTFIIVCTFVKFESEITYFYGDGSSFTVKAEQNLLNLWSATVENPNLKGLRLYALMFGMGLAGVLIDWILIYFVWGGLLSSSQRLINKRAKYDKQQLKETLKEEKAVRKELKELQKVK